MKQENTVAVSVNRFIQISVSGILFYVFIVLVVFCTELNPFGIEPQFLDNVRCITTKLEDCLKALVQSVVTSFTSQLQMS